MVRERFVLQCPFCRIAEHEEPAAFVYEDGELMAFMDKNPISLGHTLVVPKAHYETVLDLPPDLAGRLFSLAVRVARAVWAAFKPDGLNLLQNNMPAAGQSVPHIHIHVIPRYYGDGITMSWPARHKPLSELSAEAVYKILEKIAPKVRCPFIADLARSGIGRGRR